MTDEVLAWRTARFRELEVADDGWTVTVCPEQSSRSRSTGCSARPDTIDAVRALAAPANN